MQLVLLMLLAMRSARADPSIPWTPTPAARHALELLADDGGLELPLTQWPLPRTAVVHALDRLPRELSPALDTARRRVLAELRDASAPAAAVAVRNRGEALAGFGDEATPGSWATARSGTLVTPVFAAQVGARIDPDTRPSHAGARLRLDDTAIAFEALGAQWQAWSHRSWWGPGWQSSLLLGNNSPAFVGAGLQRAEAGRSTSRWLSWMGPWTYELFIASNDDPMDSFLVGTRITLRPLPLLELALSRTAQWGGHGRPQSLASFLKMLVGRGVNANGAEEAARDPANEMSGFELRLRCPGSGCAGYVQLIGEDATHNVPSSFLGLYGVEAWSADGRHRWFAELVDTVCGMPLERMRERGCAYRNGDYPAGYANAARWIGSAAGADSTVLTLGWLDAERDLLLRVHAGSIGARVGVFSIEGDPVHSGHAFGASARKSWTWGRATVRAELDWLQIDAAQGRRREAQAGASVHVPF